MSTEITNPVKAIRTYCLQCSNGSSNEVKDCPISRCPLFSFRFGKNPHRQRRELTELEKEVLVHRLQEARKNSYTTEGNEVTEDG